MQQLYIMHSAYLSVLYLSQNSDFGHKLIGFYNGDEKCLLRGTKWVFT